MQTTIFLKKRTGNSSVWHARQMPGGGLGYPEIFQMPLYGPKTKIVEWHKKC